MDSNKGHGKWWLLGLPALLICLPCLLPVLAVVILAAGGAGAIGSFVSGNGGPLALGIAAILIAAAASVYLVSRLRRRRGAIRLVSGED